MTGWFRTVAMRVAALFRPGHHAPATAGLTNPNHERQAARQLATAIDRAIALGLMEHADRLAVEAAPLALFHPPLTERLARLRLAQDRAEGALAIIDACRSTSASLKLLRMVCLLLTGRRVEAHLDLIEDCRRSSASIESRLLLAMLELADGDRDAALKSLQRNLRHLADPPTIAAMLTLAIERGDRTIVEPLVEKLAQTAAVSTDPLPIDLMLESLGEVEAKTQAIAGASPGMVRGLALELTANEHAIATLVIVQEANPEPATISLLCEAIELALPELRSRQGAIEALARLHAARGDELAARRWIARGLTLNPMSTVLRQLSRELDVPKAKNQQIREVAA